MSRNWRRKLWSPASSCHVSYSRWKGFYQDSLYKYFSEQAQLILKLFWLWCLYSLDFRSRRCETLSWRLRGNLVYSLLEIHKYIYPASQNKEPMAEASKIQEMTWCMFSNIMVFYCWYRYLRDAADFPVTWSLLINIKCLSHSSLTCCVQSWVTVWYLMASVVQKVKLDHHDVLPGLKMRFCELWLLISFE